MIMASGGDARAFHFVFFRGKALTMRTKKNDASGARIAVRFICGMCATIITVAKREPEEPFIIALSVGSGSDNKRRPAFFWRETM